ncbi:hypothetical protein BC941DRAFT_476626 [Chlamydoabsidia padenii]|nr:hypothetical protein BC941DRAFT_476626 [Chlamydoabsidia padenii]
MKLSPIQLHYLKKELIRLEIDQEWSHLQKSCPDLVYLSTTTTTTIKQVTTTQDLPFIRFIIHDLIQPFPLIHCQPEEQKTTFWAQWQLFLTEWYQRQPCTWVPPATQEALERRAMVTKFKKMIGLLLGKLIQCDAKELSYFANTVTSDYSEVPSPLVSLPSSSSHDSALNMMTNVNVPEPSVMYGINIISVQRLDNHRHRLRRILPTTTKVQHTYFIIETSNINDTNEQQQTLRYAARRHCDFRQLTKRLRSQFPELNDIPSVPAKVRSSSTTTKSNSQQDDLPWGEMDRRRLRTFLHKVASIPILRQSQLFQQFLSPNEPYSTTSGDTDDEDIVKKSDTVIMTREWDLNKDLDKQDVLLRQQLDSALILDQQRYQQHIDDTLASLDQELGELKQLLFRPGGCIELLNVIKATEHWQDLPNSMKKVFEWGRLCFAFTLHKQLVVSELAMENRNQLKKTHAFMPYRTLATFMKIYNPMRMVKAMLDLFLARPFGGQSLMQRTILMNLQEEMDTLQKDIKVLEKTVNPMICNKLYNAVISERHYNDNTLEGLSPTDALLFVLKHPDIEPILTPTQLQDIAFSQHKQDTTIYWKDIQRLWHLYARRQDQTRWMDLLLQGATGSLLQSVMSILYQPLAQVYQAADMGTTLYELKYFMDDLVQVVDKVQPSSALDTIQPFIELVKRHEASFYRFVHKVHTQTESRLFTDLIGFVDTWLSRTHFATQQQQQQQQQWKMDEFWNQVDLDPEQEQSLEKELDVICAYHRDRKWRQLEKRRLRMMMMDQQQRRQEQEQEALWSDDEDDEDDDLFGVNRSLEQNNYIPHILPPNSITSSVLLPTFINQVLPLISLSNKA